MSPTFPKRIPSSGTASFTDLILPLAATSVFVPQLVINEIDASAATPLQAVKLLALYLYSPENKASTISSLQEWLADPAIGNNPMLRLIAGIIYMHEQDYVEALKHTNAGGTMELSRDLFREDS